MNREEMSVTQSEVAARLGLKRERVYQLERQAFAKIRLLLFVLGEQDFPLLREAFGGSDQTLGDNVRRDIEAERSAREKNRLGSVRYHRERRQKRGAKA